MSGVDTYRDRVSTGDIKTDSDKGADMDDGYGTCPRCKWAGKLRKNGTLRKHRESVDMGHFTMAGGLAQQTHGDICKGSGEKPWDCTPPEGGYEVKTTEHGGFKRPAFQDSGPSLDDYAKAGRIIQSLIPGVRR